VLKEVGEDYRYLWAGGEFDHGGECEADLAWGKGLWECLHASGVGRFKGWVRSRLGIGRGGFRRGGYRLVLGLRGRHYALIQDVFAACRAGPGSVL
jgi:hypothetical protein